MDQDRLVLLDNPGISILAVDPGGTTGFALWDAWDKRLYVDQLDAGRGRQVRHRIVPGVVESMSRRAAEKLVAEVYGVRESRVNAGLGVGKGHLSEIEVLEMTERGQCQILCDLAIAMGPRGYVIVEDFILGWGNADNAGSSGREGLSPVRIAARLNEMMFRGGVFNGDAWRGPSGWTGHGWRADDPRGWKVVGGEVPPLWERLTAVENWRLSDSGGRGVDWKGSGNKWLLRMPSQRAFVRDLVRTKAWMKEHGLWKPGSPHAMDALMHLISLARTLDSDVTCEPEYLFPLSANPTGSKRTAKYTRTKKA